MPIYAYRCSACSFEIEALQKSDAAPLVHCRHCKQDTLRKCITAARVRLSGGGYYETDEKPKDKQRHIATKESESAPSVSTGTSEGA